MHGRVARFDLRRLQLGLAIVCALVVIPAATSAGPLVGAADLPDDVKPMLQLINRHRSDAGLKPLAAHSVLDNCADEYSRVLAEQGELSHTGPDGAGPGERLRRCGYNWRHYGENLAAGQNDAAEAVAAWMASPSHRRIILSSRLRELGVGYTFREHDPARYVEYFVLMFGTR